VVSCHVTTHGPRPARITHHASSHVFRRGNITPPSVRHGIRWRALPVEGTHAHRNRQKRPSALLASLRGYFS
jgi:hypothetical protein